MNFPRLNGERRMAPARFQAGDGYIVASSRMWHYDAYLDLKGSLAADWRWVSTKSGLEDTLSQMRPRYIFFLHWNWYVPSEIYETYECVCFHMTDVPYGRGGSPLQNLILAGHTSTRLTALRMVEQMDAGPVYAQRPLELTGSAQSIYETAVWKSCEVIRWIIDNNPAPTAQSGEATLFERRTPAQSEMAKDADSNRVFDFIRMLDAEDYPHAFIDYGNMRLELTDARLANGKVSACVTISFDEVAGLETGDM